MVNQAGWKKPKPTNYNQPQPTQPNEPVRTTEEELDNNPPLAIDKTSVRLKYVDDLTLGTTINLKESLCHPIDGSGPILPIGNNPLQKTMDELVSFSQEHLMKINREKTKIIPFNFTKTRQFTPLVLLNNPVPRNEHSPSAEPLEVIQKTKLLGVICTSNGKWTENTAHIVRKATSKLWILRRLKLIGADENILLETYRLHVRSLLETNVPLWHSALTRNDRNRIERVQKMAFSIILGTNYVEYMVALTLLEEDTLENRRELLCLNFATKSEKHPKHKHLFPRRSTNGPKTRNRKTFLEPRCRTQRRYKSAVPSLLRLLNKKSV